MKPYEIMVQDFRGKVPILRKLSTCVYADNLDEAIDILLNNRMINSEHDIVSMSEEFNQIVIR